MSKCHHCGVSVTGQWQHCPLWSKSPHCRRSFQPGSVSPAALGQPPIQRLLRGLLFLSVCLTAISAAVNFALVRSGRHEQWWCLFVAAGVACTWISLGTIIRKRRNLHKTILWQVALMSLFAIGWDWLLTGWTKWSINYALPILCTVAMAAMQVLARILSLRVEDYMVYLLLDLVFAVVPVLALALDWVDVVIPSLICITAGVISLAWLLIFQREALRGNSTAGFICEKVRQALNLNLEEDVDVPTGDLFCYPPWGNSS